MVEIIYDNIAHGGKKSVAECWSDKNSLTRFNFLKNNGDFTNIKMRHITLIDYLKKYAFRG